MPKVKAAPKRRITPTPYDPVADSFRRRRFVADESETLLTVLTRSAMTKLVRDAARSVFADTTRFRAGAKEALRLASVHFLDDVFEAAVREVHKRNGRELTLRDFREGVQLTDHFRRLALPWQRDAHIVPMSMKEERTLAEIMARRDEFKERVPDPFAYRRLLL